MTPPTPVDVARDLRWRVARNVLLDPFAWVGGVLLALVLVQVGGWLEPRFGALAVVAASPLLTLGVGIGLADALLFRSAENDLLRVQPLGPHGLLEVRKIELGWWLSAPALFGAAIGYGAAGLLGMLATFVAARFMVGSSASSALLARQFAGRAGAALGTLLIALLAGGILLTGQWIEADSPPIWTGAVVTAFLGLALSRPLRTLWSRNYEKLASEAASAPSTDRRPLWALLSRLSPLPSTWTGRLLRDVTLLLRGRDARGAALLLLSPAAILSIQLEPTPTSGQLLWQVLSAAALGGGAIAYAVGPGVHRLRVRVLPWARVSPQPGRRALAAGLLWGFVWTTLHGGLLLLVIATARDGWFLSEVSNLVFPVLALEWSMAHFSVVFTLSRALGQTVNGEGMLAVALPAVAVGVALAAVLFPAAILLYPLATLGMTAQAQQRLDQLEVTW